jgi:hypothetical protein
MSTPRQQRTNNARGTLTMGTTPRRDMLWSLTLVSGAFTTIVVAGGVTGLSANGLPLFTSPQQVAGPNSCTITGDTIVLGWPANFTGYAQISLPMGDPTIRNSVGGILCGGSQASGFLPVSQAWELITANQSINAIYSNGTPGSDYLVTLPDVAGEARSFVCGQPAGLGGLLEVLDSTSAPVQNVAPGEVWAFDSDGTTWTAQQLI